jgi:hypothetical protein
MPRDRRARTGLTLSVALAAIALPALPRSVAANSGGITDMSGKQGSTCNLHHSGGQAPRVRFEGPADVVAGALATFRFVVESQAATTQRFAGFNVAASTGQLDVVAGEGARRAGTEITHSQPKANDAQGVASWQFTWRAPNSPGTQQTLFGAGNSVNRNFAFTGDRATAATMVVQVVSGVTATPTETPTSSPTPTATEPLPDTATPTETETEMPRDTPTPTATFTPTATSAPTPGGDCCESHAGVGCDQPECQACVCDLDAGCCAAVWDAICAEEAAAECASSCECDSATPCVGDCNTDGFVTVDELVNGVSIALGTLPPDECPAFDATGDEAVTVDELVAGVDAALNGCAA